MLIALHILIQVACCSVRIAIRRLGSLGSS
jgi:hypothetical protein